MARYLSDNCYCNGSLTATSLTAKQLNVDTMKVEHITTDVVQSDYVYGVTEVGGGHVEAVNTLTLANESVDHWQDLIDREYLTIPDPPAPEPDIQYDSNPTFKQLKEVNQYTVLDVAQSADDPNTLLALMTKNPDTSVLFKSTNGGDSWSYLFATPHYMTRVECYYNASSANTFGCFGNSYVYNYIIEGTHNEISISAISGKPCFKTFPTRWVSGNSYIISYYMLAGTIVSSWNSLSQHAGCSDCVSGCQVHDTIYNIQGNGTIVKFPLYNCINDSTYTTVSILSSDYSWNDIAYNCETDKIVCISSSNKVALFNHEITSGSTPTMLDFSTSSPYSYLTYVLPWYGSVLLVTTDESDWKILKGDNTLTAVDATTVPGRMFTYHTYVDRRSNVCMINGEAYSIVQTNKTSSSVMSALLNIFYPIGSVYTTFTPSNPSKMFGGVWELILNRFIYSTDNFPSINGVGGEATHLLTRDEMPIHDHGLPSYEFDQSGHTAYILEWHVASNKGYGYGIPSNVQGQSQPHNNMPPFVNAFMWKRIA